MLSTLWDIYACKYLTWQNPKLWALPTIVCGSCFELMPGHYGHGGKKKPKGKSTKKK